MNPQLRLCWYRTPSSLMHAHTHSPKPPHPSPRLCMAGEQTDCVNNKTLAAALRYSGGPAAVHWFGGADTAGGGGIINSHQKRKTLIQYAHIPKESTHTHTHTEDWNACINSHKETDADQFRSEYQSRWIRWEIRPGCQMFKYVTLLKNETVTRVCINMSFWTGTTLGIRQVDYFV